MSVRDWTLRSRRDPFWGGVGTLSRTPACPPSRPRSRVVHQRSSSFPYDGYRWGPPTQRVLSVDGVSSQTSLFLQSFSRTCPFPHLGVRSCVSVGPLTVLVTPGYRTDSLSLSSTVVGVGRPSLSNVPWPVSRPSPPHSGKAFLSVLFALRVSSTSGVPLPRSGP